QPNLLPHHNSIITAKVFPYPPRFRYGFYGVVSRTRNIVSTDSFYWLDNVHCVGNEAEISQCTSNAWGNHDCSRFEHAGVVCLQGEDGALRLIEGTKTSGILQVYYNGVWGFICDDY
ncbi:scavenger receptor cysteine-rich domain-containing protein, partial [Salmonella sp. s51228]|uniref:scavenger receptor cysteine-rich domain-containing protein n=1 Tax=Salmonella sp. s51228 TaxID=3159652 RepID=UPI00397EAAE3